MIKGMYAVKDVKTTFWSPFVHFNEHSAVREFANMVNANNLVSENPEDFELWCLGSFDDVTGKLCSDVKFIVNAVSMKKVKE